MRRFLILTLLALLLSACANVSRFEKNSLVAFGELLDTSNEPLYYLIRIDLKKSVDSRIMSSQLKLTPESPPIAIGEIQPEFVASYLPPFIPPPQWPDAWKLKAKEEQVYAGNGFNIVFKEGQLVFIGICSLCTGGREDPIVGAPDRQQFYRLPLTLRQVIEVFGNPDRIYKVNEVRY
ncbi:hypothetical protein [Marinobacterium lacunae]|uniref:hypothetical protein n=1 Tax=Marinobacterium lacunae TaxID=1232683 RepID=UPI00056A767B|nr:hypothetical protein [Marinobacterium lacunae]